MRVFLMSRTFFRAPFEEVAFYGFVCLSFFPECKFSNHLPLWSTNFLLSRLGGFYSLYVIVGVLLIDRKSACIIFKSSSRESAYACCFSKLRKSF